MSVCELGSMYKYVHSLRMWTEDKNRMLLFFETNNLSFLVCKYIEIVFIQEASND